MYGWIFRRLPGPTWLRVIEALVLVGLAIAALFTWFFPWLSTYLELNNPSIGSQMVYLHDAVLPSQFWSTV